MAVLLLLFLLSSSMITYSNAAVCVCKDGNEQALQKVIDFACGSGADCALIQQTGACFEPNTVKNHCDVAVNSFYQKKASTGATCDFDGGAFIPTSPPSNTSSCISSSSSNETPTTGIPSTGNSTTGNSTTGNSTTGNSTIGMLTPFPGTVLGPAESSTSFNGGEELSVRTMIVILVTTIATVALWV